MYNVCGIKGKNYQQFFSFLKKFDCFILLETHVEEGQCKDYEFYLPEYKLIWEYAVRSSRFGRAKGGIMMGFRASLSKYYSFNNEDGKPKISISFNNQEIYILPIYLNGGSEGEWRKDFNTLWNYLSTSDNYSNTILVGDWNCRVGSLQKIPVEVSVDNDNVSRFRKSKDTVINNRGEMFLSLCEIYNYIILNGRINGDETGELTFLNQRGASVIDYCCVPLDIINFINRFTVLDENFSDHFPITFKLCCMRDGVNEDVDELIQLLPKLKFGRSDELHYSHKLSQSCRDIELPNNPDIASNVLKKLIYSSASSRLNSCSTSNKINNRQAWFDRDCERARRRMFSLLNLFRKSNYISIKNDYLTSVREYKILCKEKKNDYYIEVNNRFRNVNDSKNFWDLVKVFKIRHFTHAVSIKADEWINYFSNLFTPVGLSESVLYAAPWVEIESLDKELDMRELDAVLTKMKNNKAPGEDRITVEFYKNAPESFRILLLRLFNNIFTNGEIPDSFNSAIIFPLHKKGNPADVSNYRGISCMDIMTKLFMGIMTNRLAKWEQSRCIIKESQAGFRPGYSTVDNIFVLHSVINYFLQVKKRKLYGFFIDFKGAFDNVDRNSLFFRLYELGLSSKFISILKRIYSNNRCRIWCNGGRGLSAEFPINSGVKQGCLASPILFSLFIHDLCEYIGGGVSVGNLDLNGLMYADDVVILADTPILMQTMINRLRSFCVKWNLVVNMNKSKIVVFRRGGKLRKSEKWFYGNEVIEIVNHYKYLGVIFTSSLSLKIHFDDRVTTARYGINSMWKSLILNDSVPLSAKWQVFSAACKSTVTYAAQVWGYLQSDRIEKFQKYFVKKLFGLPKNTPDYIIYLECGLELLWIYTFRLHLNYISKVFNMSESRYPRKIAYEFFVRKCGWYKVWLSLCQRYDIHIDWSDSIIQVDRWLNSMNLLLLEVSQRNYIAWRERADQSVYHSIYSSLLIDLKDRTYLNDSYKRNFINIIFKARSSMLQLNFRPDREESGHLCSLCNSREPESVVHFMGRCKILGAIRKIWFGHTFLGENEIIRYLNGVDWHRLVGYLRNALRYREWLVTEYNTE